MEDVLFQITEKELDTGLRGILLAIALPLLTLRHPEDRPIIGTLLCKTKKKLKVEYVVRNLKKPISVSSYELIVKSLDNREDWRFSIQKYFASQAYFHQRYV